MKVMLLAAVPIPDSYSWIEMFAGKRTALTVLSQLVPNISLFVSRFWQYSNQDKVFITAF